MKEAKLGEGGGRPIPGSVTLNNRKKRKQLNLKKVIRSGRRLQFWPECWTFPDPSSAQFVRIFPTAQITIPSLFSC